MKELSTFLNGGKEGITGHKIETFESKQYVTKIWFKLYMIHGRNLNRSWVSREVATDVQQPNIAFNSI